MLTPTQDRTLAFIRRYLKRRGYAPSLIEIAEGIGISSKGTAHRHVQALAEAGAIRLIAGRKRGIELVEAEQGSKLSLPLLGAIAAGRPIEAIAGRDRLDLADYLLGDNRYALQIKGDSMVGIGILDGDLVIIEGCDSAEDNAIVVALIDDEEATLKRLKRLKSGRIKLIAENPNIPPMTYAAKRVRIQGVLVGQLRRY
ncbi:MAG: repressor LexA [gamma proteobacterium symbiont of Ctena orbiculata]|uniref:LexA repressor n=1 Tax=Candidatus Thiodiazotropha taylori TaxID=2792791 RepID=A0A944MAZ1_9GAMM|nr:transcriptional repressor LexA [Candidatus Thiodiazotropha taylori]PUB88342.1 MAG: transcriptional repressor LexA [gamma proteobacterium symbiont of Ctena orbiculata]MBT2988077.1 transcriptional repressor LexA [Candidatus Thiodiazotropha taylori]MBT2998840.1 transcriptional repressor LexA [Candidatus Thiodiazotropha taylori]MBT3002181.1 transcriptional repressor LexA [Candidatus Thiodiazotropha taylori]